MSDAQPAAAAAPSKPENTTLGGLLDSRDALRRLVQKTEEQIEEKLAQHHGVGRPAGILPGVRGMNSAGIWDWAGKMSEAIHKEDEIRTLSRQVARHECGDCSLWMTRSCPRERHDNKSGMGRGPSMSGSPCSAYAEKPHVAELRRSRVQALQRLKETTP